MLDYFSLFSQRTALVQELYCTLSWRDVTFPLILGSSLRPRLLVLAINTQCLVWLYWWVITTPFFLLQKLSGPLSLPETKRTLSVASTSRWQQTVSMHFRVSAAVTGMIWPREGKLHILLVQGRVSISSSWDPLFKEQKIKLFPRALSLWLRAILESNEGVDLVAGCWQFYTR